MTAHGNSVNGIASGGLPVVLGVEKALHFDPHQFEDIEADNAVGDAMRSEEPLFS